MVMEWYNCLGAFPRIKNLLSQFHISSARWQQHHTSQQLWIILLVFSFFFIILVHHLCILLSYSSEKLLRPSSVDVDFLCWFTNIRNCQCPYIFVSKVRMSSVPLLLFTFFRGWRGERPYHTIVLRRRQRACTQPHTHIHRTHFIWLKGVFNHSVSQASDISRLSALLIERTQTVCALHWKEEFAFLLESIHFFSINKRMQLNSFRGKVNASNLLNLMFGIHFGYTRCSRVKF